MGKNDVDSTDKIKLSDITFSERYVFNPSNNCYVFLTSKKLGKDIVLEKGFVKRIIQCYSNWNGKEDSITELSLKFGIPKNFLTEILNCLDFKHDDVPVLNEELLEKNDEVLVDELLTARKFQIYQEFKKKDWKEIVQKAQKWDEFKALVYNPFEDFLSTWQPPKYQPYKTNKSKTKKNSLLAILSDLHFGSKSDNSLFRGKQQSTNYTISAIRNYYKKIIDDVNKFNYQPEEICIVSVGDIIHTATPFSTTTKGVSLKSDLLNEELFDVAFNTVLEFIIEISKIAPKTRIYSCRGNHAGVLDNILFKALSAHLRNQKNIQFEVFHAHSGLFKVQNTLCLLSHGAIDSIKAKLPKGEKLNSHIQSMFLSRPDLLNETKNKVFLCGDLHHGELIERNDFLYVMAPSTVRGDNYSDNLGLNSRPAQQALLIDGDGIKNVIHFYFD